MPVNSKTSEFLPASSFILLALTLAAAPGCGSSPPAPGGTGGISGSGGAINASSGGGVNGTGGSVVGSGGGTSSSGGSASSSGGAASSGGATSSGGAASTGGTSSSGGSDNGTPDAVEASTGCGQAAPADGNATIDVDGTTREYILALPENYNPDTPYRLVFAWHPWGGSAQQVAGGGYYGLLSASEGQAILVSPEGLPFGGESLGWGNQNGQDIAFLEAMIERFDAELCFDHNRMFSTGFSFGGMMSNAVACAGLARAVAPMAGNSMVAGCADGTQPVAYMGFHGDMDKTVLPEDGRTARDIFVERNGCGAAQPSESDWCEKTNGQNEPCMCTSYEGCTEGYPVTWCEFGGGHTPAPNSGQTIWDFFAQF